MSVKKPSAPFSVEATNAASSTEPTATFAPRADHSVPLFASRTITVTESPADSRSRATTEPTCPVTPATTNFDIDASSFTNAGPQDAGRHARVSVTTGKSGRFGTLPGFQAISRRAQAGLPAGAHRGRFGTLPGFQAISAASP